MEKRQISDNGGKGRFQVVGQIHDEVIFPLLCVFSQAEIFLRLDSRQIQLIFHVRELFRERNGGGLRFRQRFGGVDDGIQVFQRFFDGFSHKSNAADGHNDKDDDGREHLQGLEETVKRRVVIPDKLLADKPGQKITAHHDG